MNKTPVPSPDGVPPCFGVQYDDDDLGCKRCPVVETCAPFAVSWGDRRSLSSALADLDTRLAAPTEQNIEAVYDRLHRDIFGRRSTRKASDANHHLFSVVDAWCLREGVDATTYIAGNMWAMKPWVEKNSGVGFQPNHLSGDKAARRYHAYANRQRRRFSQRRHTGETSGVLTSDIRQNFVLGEYVVGLEYVRTFIADGDADWNAAIEEAQPPADWIALEVETNGKRNHELRAIFGTLRLRDEKTRAELRAACDVAEQYEHDLQHSLGLGHMFDWRSFAELLARLYPLNGDTVSPISGVSGMEWHGRR